MSSQATPNKKKAIIAVSIIIIVFTVIAVVVLTVDFVQTEKLYIMTSRSHKVFAVIDELDSVEGLELTGAEKGIDIEGIAVTEKREYKYGDIVLSAYVVDDSTLTNKLLEKVIGENASTTFDLSEGFGVTRIVGHVEYYVFSGKNLLIARTNSGAKKMNDLVVALDNRLSVEVISPFPTLDEPNNNI